MSGPLRTLRHQRLFALGALFLAAGPGAANLRVGAVEIRQEARTGSTQTATRKPEQAAARARAITGIVQGPDEEPIAGATVVVGLLDTGTPNHHVLKTDEEGHFSWPLPPGTFSVYLCAHKEGWTASATLGWTGEERSMRNLKLRLGKPGPHAAILVDTSGKPVAGAGVRLEMFAQGYERKDGGDSRIVGAGFTYFRRDVVEGSPLERLFVTKTDVHGAFSFGSLPPDAWPRLAVTTADGRHHRVKTRHAGNEPNGGMMEEMGFVPMPGGKTTSLVIHAAARVQGRVITRLPGVSVSGLKVMYQSSRPRQDGPTYDSNFGGTVVTDAEGRFVMDDLNEGTINIAIDEPAPDVPWTYRSAQDVELKSGWTRAVKIELIEGVAVEGTVVSHGRPFEGADLGTYGPNRPRSSAMTRGAKTDALGRYHYRLPPGETLFYVMGSMGDPPGQSQTVTIPEGVTRYEVPAIEIASTVIVGGRVVDSANRPVAKARVLGVCQGGMRKPFAGPDVVTDATGEFRLPTNPTNAVPSGTDARLQIRLADGTEHEAAIAPGFVGTVSAKLPFPNPAPKQGE